MDATNTCTANRPPGTSEYFNHRCESEVLVTFRVILHATRGSSVRMSANSEFARHEDENAALDLDGVNVVLRFRRQFRAMQGGWHKNATKVKIHLKKIFETGLLVEIPQRKWQWLT